MGNCTTFKMFENPRKGRQPRNFIQNVPKILVLKSSSEQIFSENWLGCPRFIIQKWQAKHKYGFENLELVLKVKHVEEKNIAFRLERLQGPFSKVPFLLEKLLWYDLNSRVPSASEPEVWKPFSIPIQYNTSFKRYKTKVWKYLSKGDVHHFPSPHYLPLGLRGWDGGYLEVNPIWKIPQDKRWRGKI